MSAVFDAALTGWAYHLYSPSQWVWLPLTAPTADKSGNIKENRRAAVLRHQRFILSSPPPPHLPPPSPLPKQQLPLLLVFPFPSNVSELSEGGCDITRIRQKSRGSSHQRQPVLCQASPKASCDPALVSAHQDDLPRNGREEKYWTECFSILLTDRIVCSSPVSASRYVEGFQIGKGKNLASESRMNYWVWKCQNCSVALRWIPEKHPRCDHGTNTQDLMFKKAEKSFLFFDWSECVWLYQVKRKCTSQDPLAWEAFGNLHSEDLAQCQLIWKEAEAALKKNPLDSLFIYLNWSIVMKSYVSHHLLLERKRGICVCQNI